MTDMDADVDLVLGDQLPDGRGVRDLPRTAHACGR